MLLCPVYKAQHLERPRSIFRFYDVRVEPLARSLLKSAGQALPKDFYVSDDKLYFVHYKQQGILRRC